jgi:GTP-binding protein Era
MKEGSVLLIGRPNVGKSTFVNNLLGQKVAITSPKPQTTRFSIKAVYEDDRGKIIFVDTPGIIGKAEDSLSKKINAATLHTLNESVDLVIYMVDQSRKRDFEEAKVLGLVRKINHPKILVINKIDKTEESFLPQYKFLEDEFENVFQISALENKHMKPLLDKIFEMLPEVSESKIIEITDYPILNIDARIFISE